MEMIGATMEQLFSTWSVPIGYKRDEVYSLVENQAVKSRLGGLCEMAASLGVSCKNRQLESSRHSDRTRDRKQWNSHC
jgi:hypothetical protein